MADWHPHCKRIKPRYQELLNEVSDAVFTCEIDADANEETAKAYSGEELPTFQFFKG